MATVTIKGFIHKHAGSRWTEGGYQFFSCKDMSNCDYVLVGPHQFDYEIPDSFNPVAAEVATIEKRLNVISDEYHSQVRQLKGRIQELMCIENSPSQS